MVASTPLWLSTRTYPLLPIAPWFPVAPASFDRMIFGGALFSLVAALRFYRPAVIVFLIISFYLAMSDQARWQPWFYLYWVMLLLSLAKGAAAVCACRVAISAVYVWSGIQKCNSGYFEIVVPFFTRGAAEWLPAFATTLLRGALAAGPAVEIFIGVAVWFLPTRRVALAMAGVVHATALLLLGPLGHGHNWIVWPWNIAMPVLLTVLFPLARLDKSIADLLRVRWATGLAVLFTLLPTLSLFGYWDSYLSFSLYTGRITKADIYITEGVKNRLPPAVLEFVVPTPAPYNRDLQGPYVVLVELWADRILRVPPLPERRGYLAVAKYLTQFAPDPGEVHMVLIPRVGRTVFYSGSDLRKEAAVPLD